jgi:myo-inositol-1(or 4)-monophosphatase
MMGKLPTSNHARKRLANLDLLNLASDAATRAAAFIRESDRPAGPAGWGHKQARDFVTHIDRGAEELIARMLLAGEPGSRIIGEELSPSIERDGLVWIVDPLDGTANFLHGYPWYGVSIAAAIDGVLEAAVVVHVPRNDVYTAARGRGAWLGDRRLAVSTITEPDYALIGTGYPFKDLSRIDEYQRQFWRVAEATSGIRRAGAAALDLAAVAAGEFEAFWEQYLATWDTAAGTLLVREAGGRVTTFAGTELGLEHAAVIAGNPALHAWLLDVVQESLRPR